jgi:hypothetical protein
MNSIPMDGWQRPKMVCERIDNILQWPEMIKQLTVKAKPRGSIL